jgi:hypothetical protein
MPRLIRPMMASLRRELPRDDDRYGWEFKWDGVRAIANVSGRQGRSATYGLGVLVRRQLPGGSCSSLLSIEGGEERELF